MNIVQYIRSKITRKPPVEEKCWITMAVNDILMWKNPIISTCFCLTVNIMIWILQTCEARPLGLLGAALLVAVLIDALATFFNSRGKRQCSIRTRSFQTGDNLNRAWLQTRQWFSVSCNNMAQLRRDNPSKFCCVTCSSFALVILMGSVMGSLLWHTIATLAMLSPLISSFRTSLQCHTDSDGEVEEFLPEMSQNAIDELQRANEMFTNMSEPYSLASENLSLPNEANMALSYAAGEVESSEEEDMGDVHNKSSPSSSLPSTSDSDEEFGLHESRNKASERHRKTQKVNENPSAATATGWLTSVFKSKKKNSNSNSESESEFEFVEHNEL